MFLNGNKSANTLVGFDRGVKITFMCESSLPAGVLCPSLVVPHSEQHWSPGCHTQSPARHDAGWRPAAELQLQALAMMTAPSLNWTANRIKITPIWAKWTKRHTKHQKDKTDSEMEAEGPEGTALCQLFVSFTLTVKCFNSGMEWSESENQGWWFMRVRLYLHAQFWQSERSCSCSGRGSPSHRRCHSDNSTGDRRSHQCYRHTHT